MNPLEQRRHAIQKAKRVRSARAALREECRELGYRRSARRIADLLDEGPPAFLGSMLTWDLLRLYWRGHNGGENRVRQIKAMLRQAQIEPWTDVGGLTERQRHELAEALRAHVRSTARYCKHDGKAVGRSRLTNGMLVHEIVCEDCEATLRMLPSPIPYHPERTNP